MVVQGLERPHKPYPVGTKLGPHWKETASALYTGMRNLPKMSAVDDQGSDSSEDSSDSDSNSYSSSVSSAVPKTVPYRLQKQLLQPNCLQKQLLKPMPKLRQKLKERRQSLFFLNWKPRILGRSRKFEPTWILPLAFTDLQYSGFLQSVDADAMVLCGQGLMKLPLDALELDSWKLSRGAKGLLHRHPNFFAFKIPGSLDVLTSICYCMYSTKHICGKQIQPFIFLYKEFLYSACTVYIYIYLHACMQMHTGTYICRYAHRYTYTIIYKYTFQSVHIQIYIYIHLHM